MSDVSTDSLTVSWEAPEERFTGYTLWLLGVADTEHSTNTGTRTASFRRLVAGKLYTVVLVTVSGDQKSVALEGIFYTSKYFDQSKDGVWACGRGLSLPSPTCLWGQPHTCFESPPPTTTMFALQLIANDD